MHKCGHCGGEGIVRSVGYGGVISAIPCRVCGGRGRFTDDEWTNMEVAQAKADGARQARIDKAFTDGYSEESSE